MRAVEITGGSLEVTDVPDPSPGPGEAVVQVERCGICGTDLHLAEMSGFAGLILGHEVVGTVVEVGERSDNLRVEDVRIGQRVAVKPSDPCGTCGPCRREEPHACIEQWATHIGIGRSGGYAEYLVAPTRSCVPVPGDLQADAAALAEPYAVALHGLSLVPMAAGTEATVIGAGPIGLMVTAALASRGFRVVVVEPSARRRAAASDLGAAEVHEHSADLPEGSRSETSFVLECSGAEGMVDESVRLARVGGHVVLMATSDQPVRITPGPWLLKEVRVTPSIGYSMADFVAGLRAVQVGLVSPTLLSVETLPLEDVNVGFDALRRGDAVKIQLAPGLVQGRMSVAAAGESSGRD